MTHANRMILADKRRRNKERLRLRIQRRKEKRAIRMAPKKALAAWSLAIRAIGYCEICGPGVEHKVLNAHHLLPKERYPEFRLHPMNGVSLCPNHHKWSKWSAHRNPIFFVLWIREKLPEKFTWAKKNMGVEKIKE